MKEIVCNINAFDFSQMVFVYHDGKREKTIHVAGLTELEQTITQLYLAGDINVVHLYGDVEFVDEIVKNIQKNNNIRIEVH